MATSWNHEGYHITLSDDGRFQFTDGDAEDATQNYYETLAKAREAIDSIKANEKVSQRERLSIPGYASTKDGIVECEITGVHAGTLDLLSKPKFRRWDGVTLYYRCPTVKVLLDKETELQAALEGVRESLTQFKFHGYNWRGVREHGAVVARVKQDVARMEAKAKEQSQ